MIAVDTNVLVYAHRPDSPFHQRAKLALTELAEGGAIWALPWPCIHEFYAVVSNPRVFTVPTPAATALDQVLAWTESPSLRLLTESAAHLATLTRLVAAAGLVGAAVHDARIAAICLDHGVRTLLTMDRNFSRFPGLPTRSLLA